MPSGAGGSTAPRRQCRSRCDCLVTVRVRSQLQPVNNELALCAAAPMSCVLPPTSFRLVSDLYIRDAECLRGGTSGRARFLSCPAQAGLRLAYFLRTSAGRMAARPFTAETPVRVPLGVP